MSNAAEQKAKNKSKQNLKYSKAFTNVLVILRNLCFENVAHFKQLIDIIQYNGPIIAMTDNTKLKLQLKYSSTLGCIIRSILSKEEIQISIYSDIPKVITKIKTLNKIAKTVFVIALIPNKRSDTAKDIEKLYRKLIEEIAPQLYFHILSLESDSTITEF
ncbi:1745_t:CDS:2 [Cetraspora pellucida]|uniref:1745_t:CDS:1 n=1 Tax=Cetraspora pellucida TaxID=1433469 RepID=A0A9N9NRI5_9GLOM|nr:1745_t:CDS:2 [Cetraspora pellucida]